VLIKFISLKYGVEKYRSAKSVQNPPYGKNVLGLISTNQTHPVEAFAAVRPLREWWRWLSKWIPTRLILMTDDFLN
jgi:hypothetical protein